MKTFSEVYIMKIYVWRPPKFIAGILKGIKKKK